jgi:hypothetical protein
LIIPVLLTGIQVYISLESIAREPDPDIGIVPETEPEQESAPRTEEVVPTGTDLGLVYYRDEKTRKRVFDFYTGLTGSEEISRVILHHADVNDVSVNLAFSVAWIESRYKPTAVNRNSTSIDRGLFQLNNRSFPDLAEHQFWDPEINAQHGLAYLRWCLREGGNEVVALAMYNAGRTRVHTGGTPKMTLHYISHVLEYRNRLDTRFNESFISPPGSRMADTAADTSSDTPDDGADSDALPDDENDGAPTPEKKTTLSTVERLTLAATSVFDRRRDKE